jgi:hypothetical protein
MTNVNTIFGTHAPFQPTPGAFRSGARVPGRVQIKAGLQQAVADRRHALRAVKWSTPRFADAVVYRAPNPQFAAAAAFPQPSTGKLSPALSLSIIAGGATLLWAVLLAPLAMMVLR